MLANKIVACLDVLSDDEAEVSTPLWERMHPLFRELERDVFAVVDQNLYGNDRPAFASLLVQVLAKNSDLRHRFGSEVATLANRGLLLPQLQQRRPQLSDRTIATQINKMEAKIKACARAGDPEGREQILVVLTFRCDKGNSHRRRNLLACLLHLSEVRKSIDIKIVAVEQDRQDSHRNLIEGIVDKYIFAYNPGEFNAAWGRNIGVIHGPEAPVVILYDIDAIVPQRVFVQIGVCLVRGVEVLIPFDRGIWVDREYSCRIVDDLIEGKAFQSPMKLSGYVLSDIHGLVVVCTRKRYLEVAGQDERFRGWGEEDNQFFRSLYESGPVNKLPGWIVHLFHTRPTMTKSGRRLNEEVLNASREYLDPIGSVGKYQETY